ncbi:hypothetical protein [Agromyces salentinus]|uniref:Uncharacterized protein n=1 Tax=Agromyces salentinus TaxID=269421 RepID=A0ABN2MNH9_9MICO|nr:hypothetical protein [Agromyces salentinus]
MSANLDTTVAEERAAFVARALAEAPPITDERAERIAAILGRYI